MNPQFWNPVESWRNKWKKGFVYKVEENKEEYSWERNPRFGERFPGSSTVFVFLTDAWHLLKEIMISSLILSIVIMSNSEWYFFFIYRSVFGVVFEIIYRKGV